MFIKVEPAEFFMYRVILVFDLENPNAEDEEVRDYMNEWELEPKYQRTGDFEGSNSEIMQFGGCYLGRHLGKISEIQRSHVEREIISAEIAQLLDDPGAAGRNPGFDAGGYPAATGGDVQCAGCIPAQRRGPAGSDTGRRGRAQGRRGTGRRGRGLTSQRPMTTQINRPRRLTGGALFFVWSG